MCSDKTELLQGPMQGWTPLAAGAVVTEELSSADLGELMGDDSAVATAAPPATEDLQSLPEDTEPVDEDEEDDDEAWAEDEEE